MTVSACPKERRPSRLKERGSGEGGGQRGGRARVKREAFGARESERPRPPDRGGGAERSHFSLARPLPRGRRFAPREHARTDRKGGVRRGGEGRARRAQDPTSALGGRYEQERDTLGHNRFQFWELFRGAQICVCSYLFE